MLKLVCAVLGIFLVTACGGGGGGGGDSAPAPAPASQAVADTASTTEETSVTVNPTANDINITASTITVSSNPTNGTATLSGTSVLYQPNVDFAGSDSFQYQVSGTDSVTRTGTVTVTVSGVNDAPVAVADDFTVTEDTPTDLLLISNDSDIDSALTTVNLVSIPASGTLAVNGTQVTYTPAQDFSGTVRFDYSVSDAEGATSNTVSVGITVEAVTTTLMMSSAVTIPAENYTATNNAELGATALVSPLQSFEIPPNTVSFLVALQGADAGTGSGQLFIAELISPSGTSLVPFQRGVNFCDGGMCTTLVPRNDNFTAEAGTWQMSVGSLDGNLANVDFANLTLNISMRVGPTPDLTLASPAQLNIKPFVSATTPTQANMQLILDQLIGFGAANGIIMNIAPFTVLADARFNMVPGNFQDPLTNELVAMGDPTQVNLFFVESFSGAGGGSLLGLAGGIPGPQGLVSTANGVLVNATATFTAVNLPFWARTTAEIAFHEMGHYLGLYHTTEQTLNAFDVLTDTPECTDTNANLVAEVDECADGLNPMFWNNDFLTPKETLTAQQRRVLYYAPIALPGS
tara:strand:+ start:108546 stop:110273 length:1728 start_codon:yes stop_codon:yes gene_type:complete